MTLHHSLNSLCKSWVEKKRYNCAELYNTELRIASLTIRVVYAQKLTHHSTSVNNQWFYLGFPFYPLSSAWILQQFYCLKYFSTREETNNKKKIFVHINIYYFCNHFSYIFNTSVTKFLLIICHASNLNELALSKLVNLPLGVISESTRQVFLQQCWLDESAYNIIGSVGGTLQVSKWQHSLQKHCSGIILWPK